MGTYVIRIPDIGEGIAEVELIEWHVKAGDAVVEDQLLADVMTDKATVGIPSHLEGQVLSLGGEVGQTLAVGSELLRLEIEGEGNLRPDEARAAAPSTPAAAPSAPAVAPAAAASPAAPAPAASAPRLAPTAAHSPAASTAAIPDRTTNHSAGRPLASPSVRRQARDRGIDLRQVAGSGPGGRILAVDLQQYAAPAPAASAAGHARREGEQAIPVIGLRRRIAQQMQKAKQHIPHFGYVEEVDVTALEALRGELNRAHADTRGKLTVLPFLIRALVLAVAEFPQINARYDDEAGVVTRYGPVHMGIATQTGNGLMVPVIAHAEALDLWGCAAAIMTAAERARAGQSTRSELTGSTLTITSLGPLGGISSTPVINHPEVAIVGANRIVERPVLQNGQVVPRLLMNLSSSFDHRVVDGMDGALFIQAVRRRLEMPALLFVE